MIVQTPVNKTFKLTRDLSKWRTVQKVVGSKVKVEHVYDVRPSPKEDFTQHAAMRVMRIHFRELQRQHV